MTMISTTSRNSRRWLALGALCAGLLAAVAAAAEDTPRALIQRTIDEVLVILRDSKRGDAQRRKELEVIARDRFDFETMSKLVLATHWKKLSKDQQAEFVDQFTRFLANDYGARIERYEQEQVTITGERPEARGDFTIKTKIVGGKNDGALVDYRMRKNAAASWKIIDVTVEGISLVANYRDQFREVASQGGPTVVIEKLKEKNASGAPASKI
jgi:phospholipid transport system substrate-binding protein